MTEVLTEFSEALAETVARAGKSVVRVEGRRRLPASGIAWSSDGLVVTAHHVLERDDDLRVGLPDGEPVPASLVGRDPTTDLAVLRADGADLEAAEWVEPGDVRVGNIALALGRPGKTVQATLGVISALGDSWRTPTGGQIDRYLQSDVAMYPGFSGGPLVGASGKTVGLNTSALLRGVTVSVPSPTVRRVVDTLVAHGRVRRGFLGIGGQVARLPEDLAKDLDQETGLLVVSVDPDSPAHGAGLLLGDTVVSLDGQPVRHLDDLLARLGGESVGSTASVRVVRGGQLTERDVVIGERG
jgi:S1-C subfamily serine protease